MARLVDDCDDEGSGDDGDEDNAMKNLVVLVQDRRVADLHGRRALRSTSSSRLVVLMFRLSTVASRTFNVSGPRIWNGLPEDVVSAPTLSSFRRRLKPFLFQQSYQDIII